MPMLAPCPECERLERENAALRAELDLTLASLSVATDALTQRRALDRDIEQRTLRQAALTFEMVDAE